MRGRRRRGAAEGVPQGGTTDPVDHARHTKQDLSQKAETSRIRYFKYETLTITQTGEVAP